MNLSESYEKAEALRIIAEKLVADEHLERSIFVFAEAENAAIAEKLEDWQKAELLHKIASRSLKSKQFIGLKKSGKKRFQSRKQARIRKISKIVWIL